MILLAEQVSSQSIAMPNMQQETTTFAKDQQQALSASQSGSSPGDWYGDGLASNRNRYTSQYDSGNVIFITRRLYGKETNSDYAQGAIFIGMVSPVVLFACVGTCACFAMRRKGKDMTGTIDSPEQGSAGVVATHNSEMNDLETGDVGIVSSMTIENGAGNEAQPVLRDAGTAAANKSDLDALQEDDGVGIVAASHSMNAMQEEGVAGTATLMNAAGCEEQEILPMGLSKISI